MTFIIYNNFVMNHPSLFFSSPPHPMLDYSQHTFQSIFFEFNEQSYDVVRFFALLVNFCNYRREFKQPLHEELPIIHYPFVYSRLVELMAKL